jgi:type IV pilus assembly protein PilE
VATDEMKRPCKPASGLTLLELLATIAIVAILSALAIPAYADYVARGRRFEARVGLLEAAHWLERWRTERGRYDDPDNPNQLPADFPWHQIPRGGAANYAVSVTLTPVSYRLTATATNAMASDACATLSIDETGLRGFSGSRGTLDLCWNR